VIVTIIVQGTGAALFRILFLILIPSNVIVTLVGTAQTVLFHHVISIVPEMVLVI
jgi:hypothetical protein